MSYTDSQHSVNNPGDVAVHHNNNNNNNNSKHHTKAAYKHHNNDHNNTQAGGRRKRRTHRRRTHRRYSRRHQRGGRRNAGLIGSAIAAALVPFGLFAAQKRVQKNLPIVSVGKTQKRKNKRSRKTARRSKK